jgi:hypothetical protein
MTSPYASWANWVASDDTEDKPVYAGMFLLYDCVSLGNCGTEKVIYVLGPSKDPDPWKVLTDKYDFEVENQKENKEVQICLNLVKALHPSPAPSPVYLPRKQDQTICNTHDVFKLFEFLKPKCDCHGGQKVLICPQMFWRVTFIDVWLDYLWENSTNEERELCDDLIKSKPGDCMCFNELNQDVTETIHISVHKMFYQSPKHNNHQLDNPKLNKPTLDRILFLIYEFFRYYLPKEIFWYMESRLY